MSRQLLTTKGRSQARFIGRTIPGAKPSFHPGFVSPQLALIEDYIPKGADWLHEFKFDGYRVQAHKLNGIARLYTRGGHDWTHRFSHIARDVQALPAENVIIDGEVVSTTEAGLADFGMLQADLAAGDQARMVCYAFDLLYLDGFDLRDAPLVERKKVLAAFLSEAAASRIMLSEHFDNGQALFDEACRIGGEGVIAKKRDAKYRSARARTWLKVKCEQQGEFVIVGFIPKLQGLGALRLARRDRTGLHYVGKAGTGFTAASAEALRKKLDAIIVTKPPFNLKRPDTKWVQPIYQAKIVFRGVTSEGKLRHASFKGLAD